MHVADLFKLFAGAISSIGRGKLALVKGPYLFMKVIE